MLFKYDQFAQHPRKKPKILIYKKKIKKHLSKGINASPRFFTEKFKFAYLVFVTNYNIRQFRQHYAKQRNYFKIAKIKTPLHD